MPSLSSKPQAAQQNITVDLLQEPVKSSVSVADKKLRNLEKRRVGIFTFGQIHMKEINSDSCLEVYVFMIFNSEFLL